MGQRYRFQIQRLYDRFGNGQLSSLTSHDDSLKPYPLFNSAAKAEAYIRRHGMIARVQRYAVDRDGSLGWTAGAGEIIDARNTTKKHRRRR